jgi:hypothetical protein
LAGLLTVRQLSGRRHRLARFLTVTSGQSLRSHHLTDLAAASVFPPTESRFGPFVDRSVHNEFAGLDRLLTARGAPLTDITVSSVCKRVLHDVSTVSSVC